MGVCAFVCMLIHNCACRIGQCPIVLTGYAVYTRHKMINSTYPTHRHTSSGAYWQTERPASLGVSDFAISRLRASPILSLIPSHRPMHALITQYGHLIVRLSHTDETHALQVCSQCKAALPRCAIWYCWGWAREGGGSGPCHSNRV